MKNIFLGLALFLSMPAVAQVQQGVPVLHSDIAKKVLGRNDVRSSVEGIRKLDLARLQLLRGLGFEDGAVCVAPTPIATSDIDMHRSLFVHDEATLAAGNFSLRRTLRKLADDVAGSVPTATPETIFQQFWDTQNDTALQVTANNPHCNDDNGKINGMPLNRCPRPEGMEAVGPSATLANRINNDYKPIGLVNRIDLADQGWKNCGEHRIVYGKRVFDGTLPTNDKNLIIFEAVLPNPKPGCRSGCRDVIEFWVNLSDDSNPTTRAAKLEKFFYEGLTGFRAVVDTRHYASGVSTIYGGSGSGQIRTNQFLTRSGMAAPRWTLKEFKTLLSCAGGTCDYDIFPISVKVNPYGVLWSKDVATGAVVPPQPLQNPYSTTAISGVATLATNFQADVIAQVTAARLANPDINSFTYEVKLDRNAAESQSQNPTFDHYLNQFNSSTNTGFRTDLNAVASAVPFLLTGEQIVNRATAMSCAGCHLPSGFGLTGANSIGPGVSWPDALAFVHVDTLPTMSIATHPGFNPIHFAGNVQGFNLSPALLTTFLPARRTILTTLANADVCDCVRKAPVLPPKSPLLNRHREIIGLSQKQMRAQLAAADKVSIARPRVGAGDNQRIFVEQKAIIAKAEAARNAELEKAGIKFAAPPAKPEPELLAKQDVPREKLLQLKRQRITQLVNAEPPRKTITGSFRSH